ncbi:MAG: SOS response-associated peptidase family protein [Ferruginibacter sp.]
MCNYMGYIVSRTQYIRLKQIEKQFGQAFALEVVRSGFAYADWDVIIKDAAGTGIDITPMHWEFIPPFVNDMKELELWRKGINPRTMVKGIPIPWLNAKSENLLFNEKGKKAMWADAARSRRCLVLATHFFEWRWYKPEGAKKEQSYPYVIDIFNEDIGQYMAGIWTPWTDKETGESLNTFAIVTTKANELMEQVHNRKMRQPTILPEDLAYEWIMDDLTDERILEIASFQLPSENMYAYPIAKDFQTAEEPLKEFDYPELPALEVAI